MKTSICEAVNITAGYGRKMILQNLSLALEKGSCTVIVGANGSGKSTLFSVLAGIKRMRSGQILLDGKKAENRELCKLVGYVPQDNPLFSELTVQDNLLLWYGEKGALEEELQSGMIERLGLREMMKKRVGTLSGGMQRRVCIGCAMAGRPLLLIMDEPGAALDLECKEALHDCLREYREAGGTVLMSSHEKEEWKMGDQLYLLKDGKLTQEMI